MDGALTADGCSADEEEEGGKEGPDDHLGVGSVPRRVLLGVDICFDGGWGGGEEGRGGEKGGQVRFAMRREKLERGGRI